MQSFQVAKRLSAPNRRQNQPETQTASKFHSTGNDPSRRKCRGDLILQETCALLRRVSRQVPLVCGFAREIRSLLYRMGIRYKRRYEVFGLDLGPYHQIRPDGRLEVNRRTRACTQDIESFAEGHPWATIVDLEIYREAWVAGMKWAESSSDSCRPTEHTSEDAAQEASTFAWTDDTKATPDGITVQAKWL
jgi:hypothetical protein